MKRCPACDRTYADDTTTFCLADGSLLSAPYDPEATQRIPARLTSPPPTEVLTDGNPPPQVMPYYSAQASPAPAKSRATLYAGLGALALLAGVVVFALVKSNRNAPPSDPVGLTWNVNTANANARPTATRAPTDYLRSPWLGLEVWQDGKAAGLFKVDLRRTRASLGREPFELRVPRLKNDPPVLVTAWTDDSVFGQLKDGEKLDIEATSYFNPYKAMADTPAGSASLMLNNDAHYVYNDDRLKSISDGQSTIFISSVFSDGNQHGLGEQKDDLYLVIFRDLNNNEKVENGEYEFLVLDF
jgi:hypothetical protein